VLWGNNEEKCVSSPGCRRSASRRPQPSAKARRAAARCQYRRAILNAALAEFAEKGFDAASIRVIADRTGLQHPLITYHFRNKDILWRSAAEYAFEQIREEWDQFDETSVGMSPLDRLRAEYRTLFKYTVALPEFHRFMRQECTTNNPRLKWVAKTVVMPLIDRLPSADRSATEEAGAPSNGADPLPLYDGEPDGRALGVRGPEMRITSKLAADDPGVVASYWRGSRKWSSASLRQMRTSMPSRRGEADSWVIETTNATRTVARRARGSPCIMLAARGDLTDDGA